jgi:polyphosphate glucokinase
METTTTQKILTIDIGGSHLKAAVVDSNGEMLSDYKRVATPMPATPAAVIAALQQMVAGLDFEKVSVGFPGYVRDGVIKTAPNLGTEFWKDVHLSEQLSQTLHRPVKIVNDADLQGLGLVKGEGLEMVITLGTGFGTALLLNGKLLPHLELSHHPITKQKIYDEYIGEKALEKIGVEKWNQRMEKVLQVLQTVFNYDYLYISGGNAKKLRLELADNITIDSNKRGLKGGARLWQF